MVRHHPRRPRRCCGRVHRAPAVTGVDPLQVAHPGLTGRCRWQRLVGDGCREEAEACLGVPALDRDRQLGAAGGRVLAAPVRELQWSLGLGSIGVDDRDGALGVQACSSAQQCEVRPGAGHQDRGWLVLHHVRCARSPSGPGELGALHGDRGARRVAGGRECLAVEAVAGSVEVALGKARPVADTDNVRCPGQRCVGQLCRCHSAALIGGLVHSVRRVQSQREAGWFDRGPWCHRQLGADGLARLDCREGLSAGGGPPFWQVQIQAYVAHRRRTGVAEGGGHLGGLARGVPQRGRGQLGCTEGVGDGLAAADRRSTGQRDQSIARG